MKKVLSIILAISLAFTVIPANFIAYASNNNQQGGYEVYNGPVYPSPGSVKTQKTAQTFLPQENRTKVTLSIQGKNPPEQPTDVVIVLDKSSSMVTNFPVLGKHRLAIAKKAISDFLDSLKQAGLQTNVSVVAFANKAQLVSDFTTDYSKLNQKVKNIISSTGTNIHAGLIMANSQLEKRPSSNNKYIILLSDGEPNYYINSDGDPQSTSTANARVHALTEAQKSANLGYGIFTIGFDITGNAEMLLRACQNKGYYSATGNNLSEIFTLISTRLQFTGKNAFVLDQIGDGFDLDLGDNGVFDATDYTVSPAQSVVTYNSTNRTIEWQIGDINENQTYELNYFIKFKETVKSDIEYYTNEYATLYFENYNNQKKKIDFTKPSLTLEKGTIDIRGYLVNHNGEPITEDGTVVADTSLAKEIYNEREYFSVGESYTFSATPQLGYIPYNPVEQTVTLSVNDSYALVEFPYCKEGNVNIEYYYEELTPTGISKVKLSKNIPLSLPVGSSISQSLFDLNFAKADVPNTENYKNGVIDGVLPSIVTSEPITIAVIYKLKRADILVAHIYPDKAFPAIPTLDIPIGTNIKVADYAVPQLENGKYVVDYITVNQTPATENFILNGNTLIEIHYKLAESTLKVIHRYEYIENDEIQSFTISVGKVVHPSQYINTKDGLYIPIKTTPLLPFNKGNGEDTIIIEYKLVKSAVVIVHKYSDSDIQVIYDLVKSGSTVTPSDYIHTRNNQYSVKSITPSESFVMGYIPRVIVIVYEKVPQTFGLTIRHQYSDTDVVNQPIQVLPETKFYLSNYANTRNNEYRVTSCTLYNGTPFADGTVLSPVYEVIIINYAKEVKPPIDPPRKVEEFTLKVIHKYDDIGDFTTTERLEKGSYIYPEKQIDTKNGKYQVVSITPKDKFMPSDPTHEIVIVYQSEKAKPPVDKIPNTHDPINPLIGILVLLSAGAGIVLSKKNKK